MDEIEDIIKIMQRVTLVNNHELRLLDIQSDYKDFMKSVQELKQKTNRCHESIMKRFNTMVAFKNSIHKIVHSSQDVSGLPIPHYYAEDIKTLFSDVIEFSHNIGDIYKSLTNLGNQIDPMDLIEAVKTCTETAETELHQLRHGIAQLETLKENVITLEKRMSDTIHSFNENMLS